ncbi:hypothetical protein CYMTET_35454 [Cymbomonas tetramitiformis]|uniref:Uncharacterized protein n=1 Tax=Cymbomonas tetramitiformis TaxID=36881 RepID=A0AAE0F9B2_9CHLO|nr:hypothetical protein CYMTET_35454 [Cymbomonas tetramitiformis]
MVRTCSIADCSGASKWTQWKQELEMDQIPSEISNSTRCKALLDVLGSDQNYYEKCYRQEASSRNYDVCCDLYSELLAEGCWCTASGLDQSYQEYGETSSVGLLLPEAYRAEVCHDVNSSRWSPLIKGKQCSINSTIASVEGLNAVACTWEFTWIGGTNVDTLGSGTEFMLRCGEKASVAVNQEWCCQAVMPAIENKCLCFDTRHSGSLTESYLTLIANIADFCGIDHSYDESCRDFKDARYLPMNSSSAAYDNRIWNIQRMVDASSEVESQTLAANYSSYEEFAAASAGQGIEFLHHMPSCQSAQTIPPSCFAYVQQLIAYGSQMCEDSMAFALCGNVNDQCSDYEFSVAGFGFSTGTADEMITFETLLGYLWNQRFGSSALEGCMDRGSSETLEDYIDATCREMTSRCSEHSEATATMLQECLDQDTELCLQPEHGDSYSLDQMYLCALYEGRYAEDGRPDYTCDAMLFHVKKLDHRWNYAVCAHNSTLTNMCYYSANLHSCSMGDITAVEDVGWFTEEYASYIADGTQAGTCMMHDDCPYNFFCSLVVHDGSAGDRSSGLCMLCAWCEGCQQNANDTAAWSLQSAEPSCGHCPCDTECAPGCTEDMRSNFQCDLECFNEACAWDNFNCMWQDSVTCPADSIQEVTGVNYVTDQASASCCRVQTPGSNGAIEVAARIDTFGQADMPITPENKDPEDSDTVLARYITRKNIIIAGVFIVAGRADPTECDIPEKFKKLYPEGCTSGENVNTEPYGVDSLFQIGTDFYDPVRLSLGNPL